MLRNKVLASLSMLALLALGGCGKSDKVADANAPWEWERKVELICPWGTGGGGDVTLRTFATELEKELGVPVVVNNRAGAGGISGIQFAAKQPADGYTYVLATPSPMLAQISGATNYDVYGTIKPLVQLVHAVNVLVAGKNAPFNNYEELLAYAKANPGKLKAGVMTITGLDAATVIGASNGTIEPVAYTEGSQLVADVVGGHIDLASVGPAEVSAMIESGDMKGIVVASEKRLTIPGWENVETTVENGNSTVYGPARGIFYIEGTPEKAIKAFEAAAQKAVASEKFQNWAKSEGLDQRQGWKNQEEFTKSWNADYENLNKLFGKKK